MDAPIENVWQWLVTASLWPTWFRNATNVKLESGTSLAPNMRFRWSQTGVALDSAVKEFVPCRRLAWSAHSPLVQAYHAWDLRDIDGRTSVVTEETQHGIMPALLGFVLRPRMYAIHDLWLAELAKKAAAGPVPTAG